MSKIDQTFPNGLLDRSRAVFSAAFHAYNSSRYYLALVYLAAVILEIVFMANQVLQLFGPVYAEQAGSVLGVLGLGDLPLIVRVHYIAIYRISGQLAKPTKIIIITGLCLIPCCNRGAGWRIVWPELGLGSRDVFGSYHHDPSFGFSRSFQENTRSER